MPVPSHFLAKTEGMDLRSLLSDWRWLVPENLNPIMVTAFGDMFLTDDSGKVHFLDALCGELIEAANSQAEFEKLCEDREFRRIYFQSFFVMDMRKMRGELEAQECYSCDVPPTLGGDLEPENFDRTDLSTHFSILGQLHRQTKDLPEGAKIDRINIAPPNENKPKSWWQKLTGGS